MRFLRFGPGATPYHHRFEPPPVVRGSPTVELREMLSPPLDPNRGLGFRLLSDRRAPSSAQVLTSFGMDAGVAGPPFEQPTLLGVVTTFTFSGLFVSTGFIGSAAVATWMKVYVEEFRDGGYIGAVAGSRSIIVERSHWYAGGADVNQPASERRVVGFSTPVREGSFYRVWVDMEGSISADGFGGFGGSGATNVFTASVDSVRIESP